MIAGLGLAAAGAAVIAVVGPATTAGGGRGLALHTPLSVAAAGLLAAVGLAWLATRPGSMG